MKLVKAHIVPTEANLAGQYETFEALQRASTFMAKVNDRVHSTTERIPADTIERQQLHAIPGSIERQQLHAIPGVPHTITFP